ncbi:MAG: ABC transporter ATP-binding protein [Firmicutes bacterium]|jgi:peptide/nickel transport system ATP-binding protein|nr:ABC transporter ATP-binding protein [Bacillota bacterium]
MKNLLEAQNLKAYYRLVGGTQIKAVDGVTLELRPNEVLGIAGESGCGKSTLAAVVSLTHNPPLTVIDGQVAANGFDLLTLPKEQARREIKGRYISVVPQGAMNALNPTQRIRNFAIDMLREHQPEITKQDAVDLARTRLQELSLPERVLTSYPHELSGGMKQRTVIVLSTLLNPKVLIADEPTSALDVSSQKAVIRLLMTLLDEQIITSVAFITHELPLLRQVADRIAIMYAGKLVEVGTMEEIIFEPQHPYTRALMGSMLVPERHVRERRIEGIPGVPPDLKNPPAGCRFHPRCADRIEWCLQEEPPPKTVGDRTTWCWLMH